MALISIKDLKAAIAVMRQILERLDQIYHVLHDKRWMNDEWPGREDKQMKTWNVRDQTKEALEILLEQKYKGIESNYKMLKKVSNIDDAKKLINEIWQMKDFANIIEMELIRREYNNGTTS